MPPGSLFPPEVPPPQAASTSATSGRMVTARNPEKRIRPPLGNPAAIFPTVPLGGIASGARARRQQVLLRKRLSGPRQVVSNKALGAPLGPSYACRLRSGVVAGRDLILAHRA